MADMAEKIHKDLPAELDPDHTGVRKSIYKIALSLCCSRSGLPMLLLYPLPYLIN